MRFLSGFCPVFDTTGKEGDVTRGKIALVENLAHLIIQDPEAVNEKLSRCLLCGGCQFSCPSGVPTLEIFMEARAIVTAYLGLSPVKKAIFRKLLPNPRVVDTLLRAGSPFQKLLLKDEQNPQKTACAPLLKSLFGDRHMPLLSDKPLRSKVGRWTDPPERAACASRSSQAVWATRFIPACRKPASRFLSTTVSGCSCPTTLPAAASPRWCPATVRALKR